FGQYPPGHSGETCLALRLNSRMSHCAIRICSRSCHAVWGAPFGLTPRSLAGKSLNTLSKATCALPLFNKATTCSRTGSFIVFSHKKAQKSQVYIPFCVFCASLWPSHFLNRIRVLLSVLYNCDDFEGAKKNAATVVYAAHPDRGFRDVAGCCEGRLRLSEKPRRIHVEYGAASQGGLRSHLADRDVRVHRFDSRPACSADAQSGGRTAQEFHR